MSVADVRALLADPTNDWPRRLFRLQGQRDEGLEQAVAAGWAMRLGPAQCALFGTLALVVSDARFYLALGLVSVVGVTTRHHPVEWFYVWWAPRHGRVPPPGNRAPRRFACLLGASSFLLGSLGIAVGLPWLFWPSALLIVILPTFVAATNICVPSMLFTALLGRERATCPTLGRALLPPGLSPTLHAHHRAGGGPWHSDHDLPLPQGQGSPLSRAAS